MCDSGQVPDPLWGSLPYASSTEWHPLDSSSDRLHLPLGFVKSTFLASGHFSWKQKLLAHCQSLKGLDAWKKGVGKFAIFSGQSTTTMTHLSDASGAFQALQEVL